MKRKKIIVLIIAMLMLCSCRKNVNKDNAYNAFLNIGYSNTEIKIINKYLSDNDINTLLNYDYISDIDEYVAYDIFDVNNLNRYINYRDKHDSLDFYHIILYVNMNLDRNFYEDVKEIKNPNDLLVLVNKHNKLPDEFVPNNLVVIDKRCSVYDNLYLRNEANENFYDMCMNMLSLNLNMKAVSGYRSREYQDNLYKKYSLSDTEDKAITYSARPRFSEHETGLAVDVMGNNLNYTKFNQTDEYKYILEHASDYGFIIRYNNEFVTGYINEAWHLRYVGIEVAREIKKMNITFDEYIYLKSKD